jgi:putative transposase
LFRSTALGTLLANALVADRLPIERAGLGLSPETWSTSGVRMNASRGGRSVTRKTFSEEQIVYALRQAEAGTPVVEVCRKLGITEQTFYRWRRQFAGMGIAELRRLRQLEDENRRLKQLVADLTLDKHMLQEVIRKKL